MQYQKILRKSFPLIVSLIKKKKALLPIIASVTFLLTHLNPIFNYFYFTGLTMDGAMVNVNSSVKVTH
jgi:hypothetical protein